MGLGKWSVVLNNNTHKRKINQTFCFLHQYFFFHWFAKNLLILWCEAKAKSTGLQRKYIHSVKKGTRNGSNKYAYERKQIINRQLFTLTVESIWIFFVYFSAQFARNNSFRRWERIFVRLLPISVSFWIVCTVSLWLDRSTPHHQHIQQLAACFMYVYRACIIYLFSCVIYRVMELKLCNAQEEGTKTTQRQTQTIHILDLLQINNSSKYELVIDLLNILCENVSLSAFLLMVKVLLPVVTFTTSFLKTIQHSNNSMFRCTQRSCTFVLCYVVHSKELKKYQSTLGWCKTFKQKSANFKSVVNSWWLLIYGKA